MLASIVFSGIMLSLVIFISGRILTRPLYIKSIPKGDLLIFAAHQDDEIITAGEFAIEATNQSNLTSLTQRVFEFFYFPAK